MIKKGVQSNLLEKSTFQPEEALLTLPLTITKKNKQKIFPFPTIFPFIWIGNE
jgi:hypothetical protein